MPSDKSIRRRMRDAALTRSFADASCWISYSRRDSEYAMELAAALGETGIDVRFDMSSIEAGDKWIVSLQDSIDSADGLIYVASASARDSRWLQEEVNYAMHLDKPVIPLILGEAREVVPTLLPALLQRLARVYEPDPRTPSPDVIASLAREVHSWAGQPAAPDALVPTAQPSTGWPAPTHHPRAPEPAPESRPTLESPARRTLDEGKMILVGRGEVGKTSLVRRLVDDEFRPDESTTQGIRITHWDLPVDDRPVRLNVWDFGGQEIMHATHRFFLTEQSLYVLVLNGRGGDEDADAEYWLRHIQSFGGESPVVVVLNKIRQHPFELNYRGLQLRYPQIRTFVRTDCADAVGIQELREAIERAASEMPEVGMWVPSDWFAAKQQLEAMDLDFMGYDNYRQICAGVGIDAQADLDRLSFVLHCLGIALNYRNDPRLRETSVLRPDWVTGGIYRILNAELLADRGGELRIADLAEILPVDRYPEDKHVFLIELMRKFDLCLPFRDDADAFLVPDLLGKEEPVEAEQFEPSQCLNFEYRYDLLPEGIIPRFIVRSRSLNWEECRAIVMVRPADRCVTIRIVGGDADARRELLAIIRYDLDGINSEFKETLGATATIPLPDHPGHGIRYDKLVEFERNGVTSFPDFVDGNVVEVDVTALLRGVDVPERSIESAVAPAPSVFLSYAHEDELLRDQLETHLKLLQRQGAVSVWQDRKLLPGSDFDDEIDRSLASSSIVLLLVSADFLASDYCWGKEVARALERHDQGASAVVPVMLRPCDWDGAPFAHLTGLPTDMQPVTTFDNRDTAWTQVAKGIRNLAEELRA